MHARAHTRTRGWTLPVFFVALLVAIVACCGMPVAAHAAPPVNDRLANAIDLPANPTGFTYSGTTVGATIDPGERMPGASQYTRWGYFQWEMLKPTSPSVWFRWTATTSGSHFISVDGTNYDAYTAIYRGTSHGSMVELDSCDDCTYSSPYEAGVEFDAVAGETYHLLVSGNWGDVGDYSLVVDPPAENDDFAAAATMSVTTSNWDEMSIRNPAASATTEGGEPNHAGQAPRNTLWWKFVAPRTATVGLSTEGSSGDTVLGVYTGGAVNALTPVASNDNAFPGQSWSSVQFTMMAGRTYRVAVGRSATDTVGGGQFRLVGDYVDGDAFASPVVLDASDTSLYLSGLTAGYTREASEPLHLGHQRGSKWFSYTPATTRVVEIDTYSHDYRPADAALAVYTGSAVNALTPVASNDDTGVGIDPSVRWVANAGTTYRIAMLQRGAYDHAEAQLWAEPMPHDDFANAKVLVGNLAENTRPNGTASLEAGEPNHAGVGAAGSWWYRWTAPETAWYTVNTRGWDFSESAVAVYTGASVNALTLVTSNRDASASGSLDERDGYATARFAATAGVTYSFAVVGEYGDNAFWTEFGVMKGAPANDSFATPDVVTGSRALRTIDCLGLTGEFGEPWHGYMDGGNDRGPDASAWFSWTAPVTGTVTLTGDLGDRDGAVGIYTGSSLATLVSIMPPYVDDVFDESRYSTQVVAGTTYRIAFDCQYARWGGEGVLGIEVTAGNDKFVSAATLGSPSDEETVHNGGSTKDAGEPAHAGDAGGRSLWWKWTPAGSGTATVTTRGSSFDTVLAVYTGPSADALSWVASNDDAQADGSSTVTFAYTAGVTYRIAVDGKAGATGTVHLLLNPPANDELANAAVLAGSTATATVSNQYASTDVGEPGHGGTSVTRTLWWRWTATSSGTHSVTTAGTSYNYVRLAGYQGTTYGTLASLGPSVERPDGSRRLLFTAVAGTTYTFAIGSGYPSWYGSTTINLNPVPTNDAFASATTVWWFSANADWSTGRTDGGSREAGEPVHAGVAGTASSWWQWTPTFSGPVTLDTYGSEFDTVLGVYTGAAVGALTPVASDDNAMSPYSRVSFAVTSGTTYRIAVQGVGGAAGDVVLRFQPPDNDRFATPQSIPGTLPATSTAVHTWAARSEPGEPDINPLADGSAVKSVWYTWTAPSTGPVAVGHASNVNTVAQVYTGATLGALQLQSTSSTSEPARLDAVAGTTYRIRVRGNPSSVWTGDAGGSGVVVSFDPIVVGDEPWTATPLTVPGITSSTVAGFTTNMNEPLPAPRSRFYSYTPATSGTHVFTVSGCTCNVAVYEQMASWNDVTLVPTTGNNAYALTGGTTYVVRVTGSGADLTFDLSADQAIAADAFSNALNVNIGCCGTTAFTGLATLEAGEPNHLAGLGATYGSIWFKFTAPSNASYDIYTEDWNSPIADPFMAVYTGASVNALTLVGANDDRGGSSVQARVRISATAGTTYYIASASKANDLNVQMNVQLAPTNDDFANATALTRPSSTPYDTTFATQEPAGGAQDVDRSVWFTWVADTNQTVAVHQRIANLYTDTDLAIFTGASLGSLTPVASNDDYRAGTKWSGVEFTPTIGVTYRIRAAKDAATLYLDVRPPGNAFTSPISIGDPAGGISATAAWNDFATMEAGEPNHAGIAGLQRSIWFEYTATSTKVVRLDTSWSDLDTVLAVYTGAAIGSLTPVVSNDDIAAGTPQSAVSFTQTNGVNYRIAVAVRGATSGDLALRRGAQPNDLFSNAVAMPASGGGTAYELAGAGKQPNEPDSSDYEAATATNGSVWYTWTATQNGPVRFDATGGSTWVTYVVYTGPTLASLTPVATGSGSSNPAIIQATAGTTYRVKVSRPSWDSGSTSGTINNRVRPQNDAFASAEVLAGVTANDTEDTGFATKEVGEPDHAGTVGLGSIWYSWTAPSTGSATVTTTGSSFDPVVGVYTGAAVGSLTQVAASDDTNGTVEAGAVFSTVAGTTYRIAVDGYAGGRGTTTLRVNARPANDDLVNAFPIIGASGSSTGWNVNGTAEASENAHAGAAATASSWWYWTAPSSGAVTIDTMGSSFNTRLGVYTGAAFPLTLVAQNDDFGAGQQSSVTFAAVSGTTYRIAVDGAGGATGMVRLRVNPGLPLVPVLLTPIGGASTTGLQPTLTAQFEHSDPAALGGVEVEVCRQATDPGGAWSSTCAVGYRTRSSALLYGDGGAAPVSVGAPDLVAGQTYVWRARGTDGIAWSAWSAAATFVPRAGATVAFSTLGMADTSRDTVAPFGVDLGTVLPGQVYRVGPAGSGQALAGEAVRLDVTTDVPTQTTWSMTRPNSGAALLPAGAMKWRDHAAVPPEATDQTTWASIPEADTVVEADAAGNRSYGWDLELTLPATQRSGNYTATMAITLVAQP